MQHHRTHTGHPLKICKSKTKIEQAVGKLGMKMSDVKSYKEIE